MTINQIKNALTRAKVKAQVAKTDGGFLVTPKEGQDLDFFGAYMRVNFTSGMAQQNGIFIPNK